MVGSWSLASPKSSNLPHSDLRDPDGEAGSLYQSVSDVAQMIRRPVPEDMREKGFEQAKKSDLFEDKVILANLWRAALGW
jgi:hypothetical protein